MDFWASVEANLASDVLFLSGLFLLSLVVVIVLKRFPLLGFFGVRKSKRIVVYLSNLKIIKWGAIGLDGRPRSFVGHVIAQGEMQASRRLSDLFNFIAPSLSDKPGILGKVLLSDVRVNILLAPQNIDDLEQTTSFIALGSPAFNSASEYIEKKAHSQARFVIAEREPPMAVLIDRLQPIELTGSAVGSAVPRQTPEYIIPSGIYSPPSTSASLIPGNSIEGSGETAYSVSIHIEGVEESYDSPLHAFIERIYEVNKKRLVFYVAGISEAATASAANFLVENYSKYNNKYPGETNFFLMLKCVGTDPQKAVVIFER